ncbi:hypothetical protein MRB53_036231 [Persea americana]|uniref:Uncharacterized protein n=1 Tax=Persea americana TaxID=3435 RepID=A0ACC2K7D4_PERAE|nr:hypothetical protein MRB53_036231 [Persea americana]
MSIQAVSVSRAGRPPFYIELLSCHRPCRKPNEEALIDDYPFTPYLSYAFPFGHVAARVFFLQRMYALKATAFFWSHCLDGGHHLTPSLQVVSLDPFLLFDLSD